MKWLRAIRGKYRLMWGWCPSCNSDAPAIDTCEVCHYEHGWARDRTVETVWAKFVARGYK